MMSAVLLTITGTFSISYRRHRRVSDQTIDDDAKNDKYNKQLQISKYD